MERLRDEIKVNPDIIETLMDGKFSWDSLIEGAGDMGFEIDALDVDAYFTEKYPPSSPEIGTDFFVQDEKEGEYRELNETEMEAVSGGTVAGVVVLVVAAAAVVVVGAFVVGTVMAGAIVSIGIAAAVVAVALVSTAIVGLGSLHVMATGAGYGT
jgi:hypothetical protein